MTMTEFETEKPLDADARRLAVEIFAKLAHVKKIAADQLLRPAGVPEELIRTFVKGTDAATGAPLTKRQSAASILEQMSRDGTDRAMVRKLIDRAAKWDAFHLSDKEYEARGVVQKAREIVGVLAAADEKERAELERITRGREEQQRKEREAAFKRDTSKVESCGKGEVLDAAASRGELASLLDTVYPFGQLLSLREGHADLIGQRSASISMPR
jgi:hypothetical protein